MVLGIIGVVIGGFSAFSVHVLLGLLVFVVGFIFLVLAGGMASTILYMDETLEAIRRNTSQSGNSRSPYMGGSSNSYNGSSSSINLPKVKCPKCQKEVDGNYSGCPNCGTNFREKNPQRLHGTGFVANKIDKKKCSKCKKEVDGGYSKCPHCGNDTFD
jgi:RNA polymerase subunit RPABC4/transcription elongation factor Spt4